MGNAFGTKKTLKEQMRENKRTITRAIRELDRERTNLQNQEKKLIADIKKMAKEGQVVRMGHDRGIVHWNYNLCRDQRELWLRIWFDLELTSPNFIQCDHNCKLYRFAWRFVFLSLNRHVFIEYRQRNLLKQ